MHPEEEKKPGIVGNTIGGAVGGTMVGSVAYNHMANRTIKRALDLTTNAQSPIGQEYDKLIQETGANYDSVLKKLGVGNACTRLSGLIDTHLDAMSQLHERYKAKAAVEGKEGLRYSIARAMGLDKETREAADIIKDVRKLGGFGWSFGTLSGKGKAVVVVATVAGTAAGIDVAHLLASGKHTDALEQTPQAQAMQR